VGYFSKWGIASTTCGNNLFYRLVMKLVLKTLFSKLFFRFEIVSCRCIVAN
jgi:hypothetical protein